MEKILFKKVELWVVAIGLVLGLAVTVFFGYVAMDEAQSRLISGKSPKYGAFGDAAVALSSVPKTARKLMRAGDPRWALRTARLGGKSGWDLIEDRAAPGGYLLLSRVDGDAGMAVVELVDLTDFAVKARWVPDPVVLYAHAQRGSQITDYSHWTRERFRVAHPLLMTDGSLFVRNHNSPMVRFDACQNVEWMQDEIDFHHSTNVDADGHLWVPSRIEATNVAMAERFNDHSIARITLDGEVLFNKSMAEILIENDHKALVFGVGVFSDDPLHVNDIEPVLEDGPHWKKGDLFISMRHRSLVVQYRPQSNEVIWLKQGPWMGQHDVDILDETTIGVFNNNVYDSGGGWYIDGVSGIVTYDFATGAVDRPYRDAEEAHQVQTLTEGLFDVAADGHVMIEEENSGRILILGPDGRLSAEFVNRAADGHVYRLGWSRLMSAEDGDAALAAINGAECPTLTASR